MKVPHCYCFSSDIAQCAHGSNLVMTNRDGTRTELTELEPSFLKEPNRTRTLTLLNLTRTRTEPNPNNVGSFP